MSGSSSDTFSKTKEKIKNILHKKNKNKGRKSSSSIENQKQPESNTTKGSDNIGNSTENGIANGIGSTTQPAELAGVAMSTPATTKYALDIHSTSASQPAEAEQKPNNASGIAKPSAADVKTDAPVTENKGNSFDDVEMKTGEVVPSPGSTATAAAATGESAIVAESTAYKPPVTVDSVKGLSFLFVALIGMTWLIF